MKFLKDIFRSQSVRFILNKYLAYFIQFINALLIAKYLGLYYFGIYGFVLLLLQYFQYSSLGVQYSLNVLLATSKKEEPDQKEKIWQTSLTITLIVSICLIIGGIIVSLFLRAEFLDKYIVNRYLILVVIVAVIQHYNNLYINLFRIFGRLSEININYLIIPLSQLACVLFFRGEDLFWALIIALLLANSASFLIFINKAPLRFKFEFASDQVKIILKRGVFLLIYNLSFYLILLSARSIASYFYDVESFGLFSFANNLANAAMMLFASLQFLFYPKMLQKFSTIQDKTELVDFIEKIRRIYLPMVFLAGLASFLFVPFIFYFLPDYRGSWEAFQFLLLAQLVINNIFGYGTLLIQRQKEINLTVAGFTAVFITTVLGVLFSGYFNLGIDFVALATLISVIVYNVLVLYIGNTITAHFSNFWEIIWYLYPARYTLPFLVFLMQIKFVDHHFMITFFAIFFFAAFNFKDMLFSVREGYGLITNKNILKVF